MTVIAGVAGQPIAHSLSPLIHRAWIAAAGLDADYRAFGPEDEAGFAALVEEVRAGRLRGLNVTAPFKAAALALADEVSDTARLCGSANLLVMEQGRLRADSTDGTGLLAALAEQAPALDVRNRPVLILGAGGAARAADLGVGVATPSAVGTTVLVVNALSAPPEIEIGALRPDAVLMDMTYRPLLTPFLAAGRARGLTTVDGLAMLIGQARPSFRALFGLQPPAADVRRLALEALGETP
jgi:shikimate dehydrogenase